MTKKKDEDESLLLRSEEYLKASVLQETGHPNCVQGEEAEQPSKKKLAEMLRQNEAQESNGGGKKSYRPFYWKRYIMTAPKKG